jgi:class 3 adenylate cyclase
MTSLPSGMVTFLFSDIEDSTRLWEKHPGAMKSALAEHDSLLKQAITLNQGYIIKGTGDGIQKTVGQRCKDDDAGGNRPRAGGII